MKKIDMDSMVTVLAAIEKEGFKSQFEVNDNGLKSLESGNEFQPHEVKILHFYRFEGESNPDDSSILYAIETGDGEKGTLIDGYGATANGRAAAFIRKVDDIHK